MYVYIYNIYIYAFPEIQSCFLSPEVSPRFGHIPTAGYTSYPCDSTAGGAAKCGS